MFVVVCLAMVVVGLHNSNDHHHGDGNMSFTYIPKVFLNI